MTEPRGRSPRAELEPLRTGFGVWQDLEAVRALAAPAAHAGVHRGGQAAGQREGARQRLDVPLQRMSYHVRVLADAGLLKRRPPHAAARRDRDALPRGRDVRVRRRGADARLARDACRDPRHAMSAHRRGRAARARARRVVRAGPLPGPRALRRRRRGPRAARRRSCATSTGGSARSSRSCGRAGRGAHEINVMLGTTRHARGRAERAELLGSPDDSTRSRPSLRRARAPARACRRADARRGRGRSRRAARRAPTRGACPRRRRRTSTRGSESDVSAPPSRKPTPGAAVTSASRSAGDARLEALLGRLLDGGHDRDPLDAVADAADAAATHATRGRGRRPCRGSATRHRERADAR